MYDDQSMHCALKYAIYSAIVNDNKTATFMCLACWGGQMSTNPNFTLLIAYPQMCYTPLTISSSDLS